MISSDKIKQFAREIKEARDLKVNKKGEFLEGSIVTAEYWETKIYLSDDEQYNNFSRIPHLKESKLLKNTSANNVTQLCDMLIEAVEALEFYSRENGPIPSYARRGDEVILSSDVADKTLSKLAEGLNE